MSCGRISGSEVCFSLCTIPNSSTRKPTTNPYPSLLFNTRLAKPRISIKTPSGSARAAINNLYGTAEAAESFYELLGISESGTTSEIRKAYKQLALKYHPDVSPPDRTEEYTRRFIRVQEAYETLSDPETRALYDSNLGRGLHMVLRGRPFHHDQRGEWRDHWQRQVMELKRRKANKDSNFRGKMTWGSRMRRQRSCDMEGF